MTVADVRSSLAGYEDDAPVRFWFTYFHHEAEPLEIFLLNTDQELVNNKNPSVDVHFSLHQEK